MTMLSKTLAFAGASALAAISAAAPVQAQVGGVATANSVVAIAQAKALGDAYKQIDTTYASYYTQMQSKRQEMNGMLAKLDKNGDKEVDQAEMDAATAAKNPVLTQIDQKEQEINKLREPIAKAQIYVVEQIAQKYNAAQQAVVKAKKLNYILAPDAFVWAPDSINVTSDITTEIDKLLPAANVTPPADWKPTQQSANLYQQVQQLFATAAQIQAARAAQQQPAAQQPTGR